MNVHNKIIERGKERVYDNSISNNSIFYSYIMLLGKYIGILKLIFLYNNIL